MRCRSFGGWFEFAAPLLILEFSGGNLYSMYVRDFMIIFAETLLFVRQCQRAL